MRLPRKSVLYQNVKLLRTDKARASCATHLKSEETYDYRTIHARIQKIFSVGVRGVGGVQIPRRGLTENFNMAKINNLAIITRWGGGGGWGLGEMPGPHVTPSGSAHAIGLRFRIGTSTKGRFRNRTMPI